MPKLSNADRDRILARSLFVDANKSYVRIAETLEISGKTVQNYQSKDRARGFGWLTLRATEHIKEARETKENMYSVFITYVYQTLREIRENEKMNVENRAQMIVSLGDSFSKMRKIARREDPEAYKLGIIRVTIEKILTSLKRELSVECMEKVIETVYEIQEELTNVSI